jgi:DNA-binding PadR family transcriptional regulator
MIKEIEGRTNGARTRSAGSIYPTLQLLEDEGLMRQQRRVRELLDEIRRKVYVILAEEG